MATNREWLYSLDVADLADWFDSEHVESEESDDEHASMTDRDPLEIMRSLRGSIDMPMIKETLCRETGTDNLIDALESLADMVERDYVRREECEGLEHANKRQARKIHDVCEANSKLKAERDELQRQLDTMRDVAREFRDERDGWKAKAEAKSAKRAAAVERLKNSEYHTALDDVCAMLGWGHEPHFEGATDALIDLLTDEDGAVAEHVTNLEWLFEHDREKLLDLASKSVGCRTIFDCPDLVNGECANQESSLYSSCYKRLREWLMAPHANDDSTPENDVSAEDVDANDAHAAQDSREKLDDRWYAHGGVMQLTRENVEKLRGIVMPYHNGEKQAKLMGKQFDQLIYDELHDTREKLEADVHIRCDGGMRRKVLEWLDRQASITERQYKENYTGLGLLHDLNEYGISVKYLPSERRFTFDCSGCEWPSLAAQPDQEAYDRIAELQARVDELTAERDHWHRMYEQICRALDDVARNYLVVDADGEVVDWGLA